MAALRLPSYEPNLSPHELDRALGGLVEAQRRSEWLICRYLADIAADKRFRALGWYADVLHYARSRFGLGVKSTRERLRIGRALRILPAIERAFVAGKLSYSRVREVTRVATPDSEAHWLELGRRLHMRDLERRVARAVGAKAAADGPAEVRWKSPETVELKLTLSADSWALVCRAMEGARQAAETPLSDAEALEAVAVEALARLTERTDATDVADPRKAVVIYQCRSCAESELETNAGAVPLSEEAAARLAESAKPVDLATEGKAEARRGGAMPAAVRRAVLARDRGRCRVCGRRRYVDVHHLEPRSEGGEHSRENCGCLCSACHAGVHEGALRIEGSAEGELRWYGPGGELLGSEGPSGPGGERQRGPELSEPAAAIVRVMGGRGGWSKDALCETTGLRASDVNQALCELELAGLVRANHYTGLVDPQGSGRGRPRPGQDWGEAPRWGVRDGDALGCGDSERVPRWGATGDEPSGATSRRRPAACELARRWGASHAA